MTLNSRFLRSLWVVAGISALVSPLGGCELRLGDWGHDGGGGHRHREGLITPEPDAPQTKLAEWEPSGPALG